MLRPVDPYSPALSRAVNLELDIPTHGPRARHGGHWPLAPILTVSWSPKPLHHVQWYPGDCRPTVGQGRPAFIFIRPYVPGSPPPQAQDPIKLLIEEDPEDVCYQ